MWRVFDLTAWIDVFVDHSCNEVYLVECRGELLCIVVSYTGQRVKILRFYEKRKAWQIIHFLENHTNWLSSAGCVALKCDDKLEGLANTIHFPRLHQSGRHMFYSVPTQQEVKLINQGLDPMSMIETTLPSWGPNFLIGDVVLQRGSELHVMAFGSYKRNDELEEEEEEDEEEVVAMLWKEGDSTWAVHKRLGRQGIDTICGIVAYRGTIYGLDYGYHLAKMELRPDRWIIRPMKEVEFPISHCFISVADRFKLVESCGKLLLFVGYYRDGYYLTQPYEPKSVPTEVKVFRMDWEMMKWRLVEDLGDRAFFWCKLACYTCASKSGFQNNSIYIFENKDAELYVFDYRDRTISVSTPYRNIVHDHMYTDSFVWYE